MVSSLCQALKTLNQSICKILQIDPLKRVIETTQHVVASMTHLSS